MLSSLFSPQYLVFILPLKRSTFSARLVASFFAGAFFSKHYKQNNKSLVTCNFFSEKINSFKDHPNFSFITIKIMSSVFYIIATLKKMLISFRLLQCWNIGQYFWWHHHFLALEIYHTCFFSATSGMGTFWSKLLRFLVAVDCDL